MALISRRNLSILTRIARINCKTLIRFVLFLSDVSYFYVLRLGLVAINRTINHSYPGRFILFIARKYQRPLLKHGASIVILVVATAGLAAEQKKKSKPKSNPKLSETPAATSAPAVAPSAVPIPTMMKGEDGEYKVVCPNPIPPVPKDLSRADVYKDTPFKAGEISTFEVSWMGMLAGYGTIEIQSPQKHEGVWHRVYHVDGKTGDWFKGFYVAHDEATAFARPWDWGVSKFYMEQQEGKLIGTSLVQKKWLDFNHDKCKVHEKVWMPDKPEDIADRDVQYGAIDAIGAALKLRTFQYTLGTPEKFLVYTSEKNWFFEATPLAVETVEVAAGSFKATKLKLQTYIGKDLQQKGDVYAWISTTAPHQLVQIQGDIKLGSVFMKLHRYHAGQ